MENKIVSYREMCDQENSSLQRGMNYRLGLNYSVILMSRRPNAPYRDQISEDGTSLIYEGHDAARTQGVQDTKRLDQPGISPSGTPTQNGKFFLAAQEYKQGKREAEIVRVYEKIRDGIWAQNGLFELIDAWIENDGIRNVYKFNLRVLADDFQPSKSRVVLDQAPRRIIPTSVKLEVWERDGGKCVTCGAKDELHFDHIIPFSRGGTSMLAENIQLLCARHNLEKHDNIE
jgi:hypothetical protein